MDLFDEILPSWQKVASGAWLFRGFALAEEQKLLAELASIVSQAPFHTMLTPMGMMKVRTTSCGDFGWQSDRFGYRYNVVTSANKQPWPAIPFAFMHLAQTAAAEAGYERFAPDSCLINQYQIGAGMGLHQDKNEQDFTQPIVSVSLGIPAVFQFGGLKRTDKTVRIPLNHGDVLVWGGESRLRYHGVLPIKAACHPDLGEQRINLTFRKAG